MAWAPSPSGTVWRKRVHLVGPPESGQVTSVVRYEPQSRFPAHDHPEGEEILVLEGVFSDEHGDWPAGTYLLNPEGFRHAPFSEPGCVLFVKLRPVSRPRTAPCSPRYPQARVGSRARFGVACKSALPTGRLLGCDASLERWAPGADLGCDFPSSKARSCSCSRAGLPTKPERTPGVWLRLPAGCSASSALRARMHPVRQARRPALSQIGRVLKCGDGLHFDEKLLPTSRSMTSSVFGG